MFRIILNIPYWNIQQSVYGIFRSMKGARLEPRADPYPIHAHPGVSEAAKVAKEGATRREKVVVQRRDWGGPSIAQLLPPHRKAEDADHPRMG